jgi:hypothetical protein
VPVTSNSWGIDTPADLERFIHRTEELRAQNAF